MDQSLSSNMTTLRTDETLGLQWNKLFGPNKGILGSRFILTYLTYNCILPSIQTVGFVKAGRLRYDRFNKYIATRY